MDLEDARDWVIVIYGVLGIVLILVLIAVSLMMYFAVRGLTRAVRDLLNDPVRPTLNEVRMTAENIRGATTFTTDTAVHPIIRVVSIGRGVRRGVGVVTGLARRNR